MKTDFIKVFKNEAISSAFNKMAKLYKDEVLIVDEDDNIIGIFTKMIYINWKPGQKFNDNLEII